MSFETVQICKNKGHTAGVFEEKFLADNFDTLVAIEKMVGAVLAFSSSCVFRLCHLLYSNLCFRWFSMLNWNTKFHVNLP